MVGGERPAFGQAAQVASAPVAAQHLPYAAGLDGLRALAVIAVVVYHAGLGWLRGGFLGVEVFFVISGYLITSLLLGEWDRWGSIDLKAFWMRRARRLLPALFAMLFAVLTYAVLFLPQEVAGLRKDVLAATFYVTNWYLILDQKSYFEAVGRPSLLQHLWSLAIEEQFYLLWPVVFLTTMRRWSRWLALLVVLAVAAASTTLMAFLYSPEVDPSRIYYGTDTRATGLLAGVALALVWRPWLQQGRANRLASAALDAVGLAAILGIVAFCVLVGQYDPFLYQGGFALLALATAAAIATVVHPASHLGDWFLGRQPLRWIGLRSYSIYLWHWPVFMLTRPHLDVTLDGLPLLALRLAATAAFAEMSYRFIEAPIRGGALGRAWTSLRASQGRRRRELTMRWGGAFGALAACLVVLGATAARAQPPPPPDYLSVTSINTVGAATAVEDIAPAALDQAIPYPGESPSVGPENSGSAEAQPPEDPTAPSAAGLPSAPPANATPPADSTAVPEPTSSQSAQTPSAAGTAVASPQATSPPQSAASGAPAPAVTPGSNGSAAPSPQSDKATVIGDSVVLSAWGTVHDVPGLQVDGEVNRQASEAIEVLRKDVEEGFLGSVVVVHIGNNGPFSSRQFDEMMAVLGSQRRVIFMTAKVPRPWEEPNNAVITEGVKRYPNAELLDWRAISAAHPEWFRDDGIHTSEAGAQAYARLIAKAIGKNADQAAR